MSDPRPFGRPQSEPPDTWTEHPLLDRIRDVGGGVFYAVIEDGIEDGGKATNVWVWHWHTPTRGAHRWALAGCGYHTVLSVEPLTLDPSLACEDGCPSHGWIRNGVWVSA